MNNSEELFDIGFKGLFDVSFKNFACIDNWIVIYDSNQN